MILTTAMAVRIRKAGIAIMVNRDNGDAINTYASNAASFYTEVINVLIRVY
jgi:hypothetical protein